MEACGWKYYGESLALSEGHAGWASPKDLNENGDWWAGYLQGQFVVSKERLSAVSKQHYAAVSVFIDPFKTPAGLRNAHFPPSPDCLVDQLIGPITTNKLDQRLRSPDAAVCPSQAKVKGYLRPGRMDCLHLERTWHMLFGEPAFMPRREIYDCFRWSQGPGQHPRATADEFMNTVEQRSKNYCDPALGALCLPYFTGSTWGGGQMDGVGDSNAVTDASGGVPNGSTSPAAAAATNGGEGGGGGGEGGGGRVSGAFVDTAANRRRRWANRPRQCT